MELNGSNDGDGYEPSLEKVTSRGSNFIALIPSRLIRQMLNWQMFLELNSKGLYQSSGKEKESCCPCVHVLDIEA